MDTSGDPLLLYLPTKYCCCAHFFRYNYIYLQGQHNWPFFFVSVVVLFEWTGKWWRRCHIEYIDKSQAPKKMVIKDTYVMSAGCEGVIHNTTLHSSALSSEYETLLLRNCSRQWIHISISRPLCLFIEILFLQIKWHSYHGVVTPPQTRTMCKVYQFVATTCKGNIQWVVKGHTHLCTSLKELHFLTYLL